MCLKLNEVQRSLRRYSLLCKVKKLNFKKGSFNVHPDLLQNCFKMTFIILKSKIKIEGQEEQKTLISEDSCWDK